MTWEEFQKKKIFVVPCKTREELEKIPAGLIDFYRDPENHPLSTPTGRLEYYSTQIAERSPGDPERPPVPHWIERGESHDERRSSRRAEKYPLLCQSNHGRWRMHAQCDDIIWNREVETMKIRGAAGYQYEPVWLHPSEAEKRGIRHGDIVKVFNERGVVLCGAYVTERLMPGVCYVDHGSRLDPIIPGWLDRGGAINTITPTATTSKKRDRHGGQRLSRRGGKGSRRGVGRVEARLSRGLRKKDRRGRGRLPGGLAARLSGAGAAPCRPECSEGYFAQGPWGRSFAPLRMTGRGVQDDREGRSG